MPGSLHHLGKAIILINCEDASIKLDATKIEMEIVNDVNNRGVTLRCEFTEDMVVSAADLSATKKVVDSSMIKKAVDLVRVIRLKK